MHASTPTKSQRRRIERQDGTYAEKWRDYEARKNGWMRSHPEATHAEYEAAIREIARQCGV